MVTLDLITDALNELGVLNGADPPSGEDAAIGLRIFNRILDDFNADRSMVYAVVFDAFTFTPNLAPHTIGPTGTFVTSQRPVSIEDANVVLNTSLPAVQIEINLRDAAWWADLPIPALATVYPTALYYNPTWPNGTLNFWPIPTIAYGVQLQYRTVLASVGLQTAFSLPPGYQSALTLTLAEQLAASMLVALSPLTVQNAAKARMRVIGNNDPAVRIATRDAGMPTGRSSTRATFNYKTGLGR